MPLSVGRPRPQHVHTYEVLRKHSLAAFGLGLRRAGDGPRSG